ncbi:MAG TPA: amino acid adenylation domain-containing protein, partial [Egibacteraceae bacterium]|nr:amino acid adenylation domain-containing protein [Egibacteraceae bacterium]
MNASLANRLVDDPKPRALHAAFVTIAGADPDRPALLDATSRWTYGELDAATDALAARLVGSGIGLGDVIAIMGGRCCGLVVAMVAALKAGAAFAILDPAYPPRTLVERLAIARPKALLEADGASATPPAVVDWIVNEASGRVLRIPTSPDAWAWGDRRPRGRPSVPPDALAYVAFTSGTTQTPRAVLGEHGPVAHFVDWQSRRFGLGPDDRFCLLAGLSHDPLLRDVFTPLSLGAELLIPEPGRLLDGLGRWLAAAAATVAHLTPSLATVLCEEGVPAPALRWVFFGGDRLTATLLSRMGGIATGARLVNFYGATETPQATAYWVVDEQHPPSGPVPIGRGIDGVQLLVLDDDGKPCETGTVGQIHVRTRHLARGYLGDDAATLAHFVVNPLARRADDRLFRSGDLGRVLPNGDVVFIGRSDAQLKVRGFRVEPDAVEDVVRTHPG